MHRRDVFLLCLWAAGPLRAQPAAEALAAQLRAGRCVVLWRHAQTTPGVGDPAGFRLADCTTQRNLSAEGRDQARAAGEWFKARALSPAGVRSSAWCRCRDTADLAFGSHVHWAPLDSSFGRAGEPDARRQALLDRPCHELCAGAKAELGQDAAHMRLDGPLADDQGFRDLAVRPALADERGYLALAPGQLRRRARISMGGCGGTCRPALLNGACPRLRAGPGKRH